MVDAFGRDPTRPMPAAFTKLPQVGIAGPVLKSRMGIGRTKMPTISQPPAITTGPVAPPVQQPLAPTLEARAQPIAQPSKGLLANPAALGPTTMPVARPPSVPNPAQPIMRQPLTGGLSPVGGMTTGPVTPDMLR